MIVTTDVPKVPPILITEASMAAFKRRDETMVLINNRILKEIQNNFGQCSDHSSDNDVNYFII